jgi:hypothetical protein
MDQSEGRRISIREDVLFFVQIFIILIIMITAIINITLKTGHDHLWSGLLCTSLGLVLPHPKLCKRLGMPEIK